MDAGDIDDPYDNREFNSYSYTNKNSSYGYYNLQCGDSIYSSPAALAIRYIQLVAFPILLLQGIVGNLLAIPILISVCRSAWSTVIYLACLAGTDLIILLIRCGSTWYLEAVRVNVSRKIMDSSDAACKAYNFSFMCVEHMNPWLVAAISVDVMIATRWPRRTYVTCTLERARYVLLLMSILIVCLDINYFWTYGVPKPGVQCLYTEEFSDLFKDWIWPAMNNTIGKIFPLATVTVCVFFTACTMIRRPHSLDKDLEAEMKKYFLELATLRDFKTICFILCLVFICLGMFKGAYIFTTFLVAREYLDVECLNMDVFNTLDMTFTFVFYSSKIYLYIAFSSKFRVKLKQGFVHAFKRLDNLCRTLCKCEHKWTPMRPRDTRSDRTKQNPNMPLINTEGMNTKSNTGLRHVGEKHTTAPSNTDSAATSDCCDQNCIGTRSWNIKVPTNHRDARPQCDVPINCKETDTKV